MPTRSKVVVADFITGPLDIEQSVLGNLAEVVALDAGSEDDLRGRIEDASAIMLYHVIGLSQRTIERLTQCKVIARCGVGYDNVDLALARRKGIDVVNVPDYGTEEVADSAIGMMLALARGISLLNSRLQAGRGEWKYTEAQPLWRLRGRVFGIVGLGRIGTAAALRAKALGMDVVFHDPYMPDGYEKSIGVRRVDALEALLKQSHVVSLHCPLTTETRHLINERTISQMPAGSLLVNTARGAVVDTRAIPTAIASGQLAGVGLDVLEHEPPAEGDPLLAAWRDPMHPAHDRLIINPHSAFYCEEGLGDMRAKGAQACRRALLGEKARNVVN